ncbi:MAG TPA: NAD-dependent epimerase/dehydratase family protein [Chloroflexota bacterium]|nr:NAD-dependent epimerase/dehydratase family protein [Chloroflexota bacterium]
MGAQLHLGEHGHQNNRSIQAGWSGEALLSSPDDFYFGRRVLVTGGCGFIGSNLVKRLVALGANVTAVDSLLPEYGGNLFNLECVRPKIWLSVTDLRDANALTYLIQDQEIIFNLAGQVSHEDSMTDPLTDLDINCRSQASLLESCRRHNPDARIVYASTRQVYGRPHYLPVDENHPPKPVDVNGINKLAAEQYHLLYHRAHGMWACALRLTNTFGPGQLIKHARQGFIAWFVRTALSGGTIQLYGGGQQQRDLTYVDDAVDAFLLAAASDCANGEVFNVGGEQTTVAALAAILCELRPETKVESIPFPVERLRIDIGDYVASWDKIAARLGWRPRVPLRAGIERTLEYYREYGQHYE